MLCKFHPKRIAIGTCEQCGAAFCPECQRIIKGRYLCPACAHSQKGMVVPVSPRHRNIYVALLWAVFLPGMGQVYNGQIAKGIAVFCTFWLIIPWGYGIVDAVLTARKINDGELDIEPSALPLAGCLGLIIILCVGPFIAVKTLRTTALSWLHHEENRRAEEVLVDISRAAEAFALDHGTYPESYSQLYFADPPYIDQLYCDVTLNGYAITCSFLSEGYTVQAVPVGEKSVVQKAYTVTTGGAISSGQVR